MCIFWESRWHKFGRTFGFESKNAKCIAGYKKLVARWMLKLNFAVIWMNAIAANSGTQINKIFPPQMAHWVLSGWGWGETPFGVNQWFHLALTGNVKNHFIIFQCWIYPWKIGNFREKNMKSTEWYERLGSPNMQCGERGPWISIRLLGHNHPPPRVSKKMFSFQNKKTVFFDVLNLRATNRGATPLLRDRVVVFFC